MDPFSGLFFLFASLSTLYVIHIALYLVGANFYDIWRYRQFWSRQKRKSQLALNTSTLKSVGAKVRHNAHDTKDLVTIAIAAHNEQKVIARCLESVRQSTYPRIEVLVADDHSDDQTNQAVRDYIDLNPDMSIRIYRMRKNIGKGRALNSVLKQYARGEFVMTLDADSILHHDAISNAVEYFHDPRIVGTAANVQIITEPTILGMLQKFEHMVGYRSKKTYSWLNCEFVIGGVASMYRMRTLREVGFYDTDTVTEDIGLSMKIVSRGNREQRIVYASDVVAMTEGVMTLRALSRQRYRWKYGSLQNIIKYWRLMFNPSPRYSLTLTVYRMPTSIFSEFALLVSPLAWGYALYMTLTQYNPTLLVGAYMTITVYLLVILWFDDNLSARTRLHMTIYAPVMYFVFYVMDFIQLLAIIRCLLHSPSLLLRKNIGSTWISPKRIGKRLASIK